MSDRRQKRLELLKRLREMGVEQARSEHVAANAELEQRREKADDTEKRIAALDEWTVERSTQGATLMPELLQQTQLYRGVEKRSLDQQRGDEAQQREITEGARRTLTARFEELSVVERLALRHGDHMNHEQVRRGYVELDEAGIRKSLAKE
jgi:flagellar biosynthesis chaperone FliJ